MTAATADQQYADAQDESPHFVRAVTEMGDTREVIASADIFDARGVKLLAKGARIDSRQFEKLTRYRLSAPLDQVLTSDKAVDATALALEVDRIIEHEALHRQLLGRAGDPRALKHALANLKLLPTVELRMTVMSEKHPEMYVHTLHSAIIAFAIAQRLRLPPSEHDAVLLAVLCHDFGEMHTDPAILDQHHQITTDERRFVHVHPITGYVLLHELKGFPPAAARAVLQHHERLDGSGYPYALQGPRIERLGRLVAVADVAETVLRRLDLSRVDMLFRINKSRFDQDMTSALRDLLQIHGTEVGSSQSGAETVVRLNHLAELLQAWFTLRALLDKQVQPADAPGSPLAFLFDRMSTIRSLVLQAGFNPDDITSMLSIIGDDPVLQQELRNMLDEMDWLLADLANEIDRRSPELGGLSQGALKELVVQLRTH